MRRYQMVNKCCRWETLDSFMQHDVQELCRVVSHSDKRNAILVTRTFSHYEGICISNPFDVAYTLQC